MPAQQISLDNISTILDSNSFLPMVQMSGSVPYSNTRVSAATLWTVNENAIAISADTQAKSQVFNYRTSLWNGSSETKGWFSWRADTSLVTNLSQSLSLYVSTGSSPSFTNRAITVDLTATGIFNGITLMTDAPSSGAVRFTGLVDNMGIMWVANQCGFGLVSGGGIGFWSAGYGKAMTLAPTSGNLLIKTTSDLGQAVQVSGAILTQTLLWGTLATPQGGLTFSGNDAYIDAKIGGFFFRTNVTTRLSIDSTGICTLGSATASQGMQIDPSVAGIVNMKFYTGALNYFSITANSNTGENRIGGITGGQFLTFYVAGSQACRLDQFQLSFPTDNGFGIGGAAQRASVLYTYNVDMSGNLIFNTVAGTKIGTAANQKLSLWGVATVVQPTNAVAAAAFVANTSGIANDSATYGGYTAGQIVAALKAIGALA